MEVDSRLIVAQRVSQSPNDKEELAPTFAAIAPEAGPVAEALIDSGFVSEAAVRGILKVNLEWTLVSLSYNLKRLFILDALLKTA